MTERPILFSAPMVCAILADRKTQTRRVLRDQQPIDLGASTHGTHLSRRPVHDHGKLVGHRLAPVHCPYGEPGDRLWVRENGWERPERSPRDMRNGADTWKPYYFDADNLSEQDRDDFKTWGFKRRPSIHMPRRACRLVLEVTSSRVERLTDTSEADAKAEGVEPLSITDGGFVTPSGNGYVGAYKRLWDSLNAKRGFGWSTNPWVWVIEFKRVEAKASA